MIEISTSYNQCLNYNMLWAFMYLSLVFKYVLYIYIYHATYLLTVTGLKYLKGGNYQTSSAPLITVTVDLYNTLINHLQIFGIECELKCQIIIIIVAPHTKTKKAQIIDLLKWKNVIDRLQFYSLISTFRM